MNKREARRRALRVTAELIRHYLGRDFTDDMIDDDVTQSDQVRFDNAMRELEDELLRRSEGTRRTTGVEPTR